MNDREFPIRERLREVEITDLRAEIPAEACDPDRGCSIGFFVAAPDIQLSSPVPFSGVLVWALVTPLRD